MTRHNMPLPGVPGERFFMRGVPGGGHGAQRGFAWRLPACLPRPLPGSTARLREGAVALWPGAVPFGPCGRARA